MKSIIKRLLSWVVQNDIAWAILSKSIVPLGYYLNVQRHAPQKKLTQERQQKELKKLLLSISPNQRVLHGPFANMHYPELESVGSTLAPKLIGCYERELHDVVEQLCRVSYEQVIDIGCAEGYYAVGLAIKLEQAKVFAYDTNAQALTLCKAMAEANNVSQRITLANFCDPQELNKRISTDKRTLIVSDCEGYEKTLFNQQAAEVLAKHDLLIEVHDFLDIEISETIRAGFAKTHHITSIYSVDDIRKAREYQYPECEHLSLSQRHCLFAEHRPGRMEWLFLKSLHTWG